MLADEQIGVSGNSTSKFYIEDSIQAVNNNNVKKALADLKLMANP